MKPYRGTSFFADKLSARQPIEGTVPRGFLRTDTELFTGKKSNRTATPTAAPGTQSVQGQQTQDNSFPDDIDYFPIPVTEEVVKRGPRSFTSNAALET